MTSPTAGFIFKIELKIDNLVSNNKKLEAETALKHFWFMGGSDGELCTGQVGSLAQA